MGTAQTRAQNKYINKVYDRINLLVDKGNKDKIKAHADKQGESLNGFINRAISETMERDEERRCSPYAIIK
jgi:predicted HicB family RNase H-like nuclease